MICKVSTFILKDVLLASNCMFDNLDIFYAIFKSITNIIINDIKTIVYCIDNLDIFYAKSYEDIEIDIVSSRFHSNKISNDIK